MKRLILCLFSVAIVTSTNKRRLDRILHQSNNVLTAKIFSEVVKEKPNESVVISAFSVLTPLAQLALASIGKSHDELLASIGMPNDNITKAVFLRMNEKLKSVKGVTLKQANKFYVAKKFELNNGFANLSRDVFEADFFNIDFTKNEETAREVNRWVEEQTNNRIKDLIDPTSLDDNTRILLVNAIYFKGLWENSFNKETTSARNFHVNKEKIIEVPTMYNKNQYRYIDSEELNAQVLELKYKGGNSALYILLPYDIDGLKLLLEKLKHPFLLYDIIRQMKEIELEVFLPRFKIETTVNLKEVLQNINIKRLFSENDAGLDNLVKNINSGLYVSDAKQKAFIEVNEEGAEAAAANDFGVHLLSGGNIFNANHLFIFFLTHENNILFTGTYYS